MIVSFLHELTYTKICLFDLKRTSIITFLQTQYELTEALSVAATLFALLPRGDIEQLRRWANELSAQN